MFDKKLAIQCLDFSVLAYKGMKEWKSFSGEKASEERVEWMYGKEEETRLDREYISSKIQFFESKETDTQGIFYENESLFIAFRGSESGEDWRGNLNYKQMEVPFDRGSEKLDKIHSGFLKDYMSVRDLIFEKIKMFTGKSVIVTGHSLGAALAVICSLDIQYNFPNLNISLYNFGSPRVGNKAYVKAHKYRVKEAYQIRNGTDIVTHVPLKLMGFEDTRKHIRVNFWKPWLSALDHFPSGYLRGLRKL